MQNVYQRLGQEVQSILEREHGARPIKSTDARGIDRSIDLMVAFPDDHLAVVEVRLTRENVNYVLGKLLKEKERLRRDWELDVELILAIPSSEVNSTVRRKCEEAAIRLIAVDIDLPIPQQISVNLKFNSSSDQVLFQWLQKISEGRRQTEIKRVLKQFLTKTKDEQEEKYDKILEELTKLRNEISHSSDEQ